MNQTVRPQAFDPPWSTLAGTLVVPAGDEAGFGPHVAKFTRPEDAARAVRAVNTEHALAALPATLAKFTEALQIIARWMEGGSGPNDLAVRNLALATLGLSVRSVASGYRVPVIGTGGVYQPDYWHDAHALLSKAHDELREERDILAARVSELEGRA